MMSLNHHRPRAAAFLLLLALAASGTAVYAQAPADTARAGLAILHIGRVNADCYADTLLGSRCIGAGGRSGGTSYLPRLVVWGQPPELPKDDKRKRDSLTECMGPFAGSKKKRTTTTFSYPTWQDLGGTVAVGDFNTDDSLPDLMITIWGRYPDGRGVLRDTTHMLCLFSQHSLDTIAVIGLGDVGEERREKFAVKRLRKNAGLLRPGIRDISGRISWELEPVTFDALKNEKGRPNKEEGTESNGTPLLNEMREEEGKERRETGRGEPSTSRR